jgi:adhesin transport system outer membrane protein
VLKKIIQLIQFIIIYSSIFLPLTATAEQELSLQEALKQAVTNNPEIMAYIAAKISADHKVSAARSGYFPSLEIRGSGGYEYLSQKTRANQLNSAVRGTSVLDRYEPRVSLRQNLFSGFQTTHEVEKANREVRQASLKVNEIREILAYKAADQFIAVRRFQRLLKLANDNLQVHKLILSKVNALVNAGKLTIADMNHVKARLGDAEAAVRDIEGDYGTAMANFMELVNITPHKLRRVEISEHLIPQSLEAAREQALRKNRSVILARATVDTAKSDVGVTEAAFYPVVDLEVDAARSFNVAGKEGTQNNLTALVVARWNVLNGGRDTAKNRELRARAVQAYYLMRKEQRTAEKEVRLSWAEMRSAKRQADALRQAVQSKKAVRSNYLSQFDIGKRTLVEVLDTSHEYFLAKGSLITADASYDLAAIRLLASCGLLVDQLVGPVDNTAAEMAVTCEQMPGYQEPDENTAGSEREIIPVSADSDQSTSSSTLTSPSLSSKNAEIDSETATDIAIENLSIPQYEEDKEDKNK